MMLRILQPVVGSFRRFLSGPIILEHKLVLLIDEQGKSQGRQFLDTIKYDRSVHDLTLVKDDAALPVYRLQPRGLAYRRAREQHAQSVEARRNCKLKTVRFRTAMADHDFKVHLDRLESFLGKGWRVRCVVEESSGGARGKMAPLQFSQRVIDAIGTKGFMESPPEQTDRMASFHIKPPMKP